MNESFDSVFTDIVVAGLSICLIKEKTFALAARVFSLCLVEFIMRSQERRLVRVSAESSFYKRHKAAASAGPEEQRNKRRILIG